MLTGFVAAFLRKGSRWHGLAGDVFAIAMLSMSSSGIYMAVAKNKLGDMLGGALTFYLVSTAWLIARRRKPETNILDWGALAMALGIMVVAATFGLQAANSATGLRYGYAPPNYIFLGSVALLAAIGDARVLAHGGISGAHRIARHLWRMCFAWFIAAASILLARQHLFLAVLRTSGVLVFLSFLPLLMMVFWLLRVRFTNAHKQMETLVLRAQTALSAH